MSDVTVNAFLKMS